MKRLKFSILLISMYLTVNASPLIAQEHIKIYCFPGQGADSRLFDSLTIDTSQYQLITIEYGTPAKGMNMTKFAESLLPEIDTAAPFILMGVSLGGMICVELSELTHPLKTIIISSAKNRNELPFRYRFQRHIPIYKIVPGRVLLMGAKMLQPIVEPDRNKNKEVFKSMLQRKEPLYMKRSISLIINWDRDTNSTQIIHIHGTNDHTIPLRNIVDPARVITGGSHMMTLTSAHEISEALRSVL